MNVFAQRPWLVSGLLILLCLVPAAAGAFRLAELATGAEVTARNARFFESPIPVVAHILAALTYGFLGVFQFRPINRANRKWHRAAGQILLACGLVAACTGLWMAHFYPWPDGDGVVLYAMRLLFGSGMVLSLIWATAAVRRRDFSAHREWMIRAYAIGMGAGTQVLTHLPWFILVGETGEVSRAILMGAGWVINLVVAELIIHRGGRKQAQGVVRSTLKAVSATLPGARQPTRPPSLAANRS